MTPLHIAFDAQQTLFEGSLGRYLRCLIGALMEIDCDLQISLLVTSPRAEAEIRATQPWIPGRANLVVLPMEERQYSRSARERWLLQHVLWPQAMKRTGANVFHGQYSALPHRCAGWKIVSTLHDVFRWVPTMGPRRSLRTAVSLLLERSRYRRAHCVLADSNSSRQDFLRYVDPHHPRTEVVLLGVSSTFSAVPAPGDQQCRERLGLSSEPYVLYLGDLQPRKDVCTLIRAASSIRERVPHRLVMAGKSWYIDSPEARLAKQLGFEDRVLFTGHVAEDQLPALYRGAAAFAYPSLYEGFGLPPLEAMACGVPVIVSNASSLPQVVGDAGLQFPPRDSDALAALLQRVLLDEEQSQRMRAAGIARAAELTWKRTAQHTLEAYRSL